MDHESLSVLLNIWMTAFVFAFGACVGSLTNVLVYRLPLGLGVVTPSSRCPFCETKLTWRENVPILGWVVLGGKCRFCKTPISMEYPIVELAMGTLFALLFVLWYVVPADAVWLGVDWGSVRPDYTRADLISHMPRSTWPMFVVTLITVGALVAMTIVDAKTFTIPLQIPWFATAVAVVLHVGYAAYVTAEPRALILRTEHLWSIPLPAGRDTTADGGLWVNWFWIGAPIGAAVGLIISLVLLQTGLIRQSFADYDDWYIETFGQHPERPDPQDAPTGDQPNAEHGLGSGRGAKWIGGVLGVSVIAAILLGMAAEVLGMRGWWGMLTGAGISAIGGALLFRVRTAHNPTRQTPQSDQTEPAPPERPPSEPTPGGSPADEWIAYPHARREMLKEMAFLGPIALLGLAGGVLAERFGDGQAPLWLLVLSGVLLGYFVGGGIVWIVRIVGSLAFGKEAMGLGDVHLMAAVGAAFGWIDATLAFFGAAFVGIVAVVLARLATGQTGRALPYGPSLAIATLLVLLCKPLIEMGLDSLLPAWAPINLP